MSAIVGIANFNDAPVDLHLLMSMNEAGCKFGPDAQGFWRQGAIGFAYHGIQTKQSNLEKQPLFDPTTGLLVAIDGFIHAKRDLIKLLQAAGHCPKTWQDAELVLLAYQVWGSDCPKFLLGEYAFAVWDPTNRRLLCARDVAGVRPLFYVQTPHSIQFATGAQQLAADANFSRIADVIGIMDFMISGGTAEPHRTPWASIKRLPAAHTLVADARGVRIQRYWSLADELKGGSLRRKDYPEACAEVLQQAIRDRLNGDSQVGLP